MDLSGDATFGEVLQRFRRRKGLNQSQLATRIGASRSSVSLWERGEQLPETVAMMHELARVLDLDDEEQRLFFDLRYGQASLLPFSSLPLTSNAYFTGREEDLACLHQRLTAEGPVPRMQAITGLGGVGKTQTALEYAYRHRSHYHSILWANADSRENLILSYVQLAASLHLCRPEVRDQQRIVELFKRWLTTSKRWLLILDNVEELQLVPQFVPAVHQGAVLLTTMRQVTEPLAQAMELRGFSEEEGALFLLRRTHQFKPANQRQETDQDEARARSIVRLLDGLPLALDQAGAYILEKGCDLTTYESLLQHYQMKLLRQRGSVPLDHPLSVLATFTVAFDQVKERHAGAIELLQFCSCLEASQIGEEILTGGAAHVGPLLQPIVSDPLLLNEAMETLRVFSLIHRDAKRKSISLHRLVQYILYHSMEEPEQTQRLRQAVSVLDEIFPHVKFMHERWQECERLMPHVLACATKLPQQARDQQLAAVLCNVASYLREAALYEQAQHWFEQALSIDEQVLGPDHPDLVSVVNGLANLSSDLGNYQQAEALYERARQVKEQAVGAEHPDVVPLLCNQAKLYRQQGKHAQAEPLYERARLIWEQALGPEHPNIVYLLNNQANLYREQSKYTQAELLYERALRICGQALGQEHPNMAFLLHNQANLYSDQGNYAQAEPLYKRALKIREEVLGKTHPDVAYPLDGLADLYYDQGNYAQAEAFYERALKIREEALGPEHPDLTHPLNGLANLSREQGNYAQAEAFYQRALKIREEVLGETHPDVAEVLGGLANLSREQGEYAQAESLYERAITLRQSQLGPHHPDVAESMHDLARCYQMQQQAEKAQTLYQQALALREQRLGFHHPKTLATRMAYAALSGERESSL